MKFKMKKHDLECKIMFLSLLIFQPILYINIVILGMRQQALYIKFLISKKICNNVLAMPQEKVNILFLTEM